MKPMIPKIVWALLAVSQLSLFLVATSASRSPGIPMPLQPHLQQFFAAVAVIDGLLAWFVFPKLMTSGIRRRAKMADLSSVFPIMIVQWALFQAITLLGYVLALKARNPDIMLPYLTGGFLGLILTFPWSVRIENLIHNARGTRTSPPGVAEGT